MKKLLQWLSKPEAWVILAGSLFAAGALYDSITSSVASQGTRIATLESTSIETGKSLVRIEQKVDDIHEYFGLQKQ